MRCLKLEKGLPSDPTKNEACRGRINRNIGKVCEE
jgi:hypothetical protein